MDPDSLNDYREVLLKLREELKESLDQFDATVMQSQHMAIEMKRRNEARLQLVARALGRIVQPVPPTPR
jgi:hypothetical protein